MDGGLPYPYAWPPRILGAEPADAWISALALPLVGRVWLACLPAGEPGAHGPRGLAATWAACAALGCLWAAVCVAIVGADRSAFLKLAIGPPLVVLGALGLLAPRALVPRHAPEPRRESAPARAAVALGAVGAAGLSAQRFDATAGVLALAAAVLANEALRAARVPAFARAAALALLAANVGYLRFLHSGAGVAALGTAAAALGLVTWLRRGDRRGLTLVAAGIALGAAADPHGVALPIAFALATPIASAAPARRRAILVCGAGLALGIGLRAAFDVGFDYLSYGLHPGSTVAEFATAGVLAAAALAAWIVRARRPIRPEWEPSGAPRAREAWALLSSAVLATAIEMGARWRPPRLHGATLPVLEPIAATTWIVLALAVAIALARSLERGRA